MMDLVGGWVVSLLQGDQGEGDAGDGQSEMLLAADFFLEDGPGQQDGGHWVHGGQYGGDIEAADL